MMMTKLISFVACCSILLAAGVGCSKKPDPTPEETALLRSGGKNIGFVDNEVVEGGKEIIGHPMLVDPLGPRGGIDLSGFDPNHFLRNVVDPVYFGFDQYSVNQAERDKIGDVADFLKKETDTHLLIEGHCDYKGTPEYNKSLGDRRAASVMQFLIDLGVEPDRMQIVSIGDEGKAEGSAEQMRMDRKAHFVVIKGT
jgi:peptidoglycan-associated lipoprotein